MLRVLLVTIMSTLFSAIIAQNCNYIEPLDLSEKLIFNYQFDNNYDDTSPNSLNASNTGTSFTNDRVGEESHALNFALQDYIQLPNDDKIEIQYPFSFSFWAYFIHDDFKKNSILNSNYTQDNYHGIILLRRNDGTIACIIGNGNDSEGTGPGNRNNVISEQSVPLNEWTHIVVNVSSPSIGEYYINGCWSDITLSGMGNWNIGYDNNPGVMGRHDSNTTPNDVNNFFEGVLDDFYLWNRTITQEEVLFLYDRFHVEEINLPSEYWVTEGASQSITLGMQYDNVIWSDGQFGNTASFSAGNYTVEAYHGCHLVCHEFEVKEQEVFDPNCEMEYTQNISQDRLVYYPLNSNAQDNSGNALLGTVVGAGSTADRKNQEANAMRFFGSGYIKLPNDPILKPQYPLSISIYTYFESADDFDGGIVNTNFIENNAAGVFMYKKEGKLIFGYGGAEGSTNSANIRYAKTKEDVGIEEWVHIVGILKGPTDIEIYIDGCIVDVDLGGDGPAAIGYTSDANGYLGRHDSESGASDNSPLHQLIGRLDEFHMWDRAITQEEILFLWNNWQPLPLPILPTYLDCEDGKIDIVLNDVYENVLWSDGQAGNTASFTESGLYTVEAYFRCHLVCEEFEVIVDEVSLDIGDDIITCEQSVVIEAMQEVTWNNGEQSAQLTVDSSGEYIASVNSACGTIYDTIDVVFSTDTLVTLDLPSEVYICNGSPALVDLPIEEGVLVQNTGQIATQLTFDTPGLQTITLDNGCDQDDYSFSVVEEESSTNLGEDKTICEGDSIEYFAPLGSDNILWSTGDTMQELSISDGTILTLSYDLGHCTFVTEPVNIFIDSCIECKIYLPNVFSPNGDNINDLFEIKTSNQECLDNLEMMIFDRWGALIYKGPAHQSWNGTHKGRQVEAGVYPWRLKGNVLGTEYFDTGTIAVLR